MEPSGIVDLCNFLEAGAFVSKRTNPLETVQRARRQRLIQFTARNILNRGAQLAKHFTTQTRHTEFQAIEIIGMTMGVYLTISLLISMFMNWYNKRVALVER